VKPRDPPFQSPSLAMTKRSLSSHCDGVRFARDARLRTVEGQGTLFLGVDVVEIDRAGGKVRDNLACLAVDDSEIVVFLHCDDDFAGFVEIDEFRLRIFRRDIGNTGHVDHLEAVAIERTIGGIDDGETTSRQLRKTAITGILVTLVLDGDGNQ
jgi:hypothetical protein